MKLAWVREEEEENEVRVGEGGGGGGGGEWKEGGGHAGREGVGEGESNNVCTLLVEMESLRARLETVCVWWVVGGRGIINIRNIMEIHAHPWHQPLGLHPFFSSLLEAKDSMTTHGPGGIFRHLPCAHLAGHCREWRGCPSWSARESGLSC